MDLISLWTFFPSGRYFRGPFFQPWTIFPWTFFPWTFFPNTSNNGKASFPNFTLLERHYFSLLTVYQCCHASAFLLELLLDYNLTLLSFIFMFLLSLFSLLLLTIYLLFIFIVAKQPWLYPPLYVNSPYHGKALNSLICADVPLRNCSLTHFLGRFYVDSTCT